MNVIIESHRPQADHLSREAELVAQRLEQSLQTLTEPRRLGILSGLRAHGEATPHELALLLGESPRSIAEHLSAMLTDDIVAMRDVAGGTRYRIVCPQVTRIVDRLTADLSPRGTGELSVGRPTFSRFSA